LNTGLFVCGREDLIIGTQWSALPEALVKIEDGCYLKSCYLEKFV